MNNRVSTITIVTAFSIALVFSAMIIWSLKSVFAKYNTENHKELEKYYIDQQKDLIENEVERLVTRIRSSQQSIKENTVRIMKNRVDTAEKFARHMASGHKHGPQHDMMENLVDSLKWNDSTGYVFILDKKGNILHHGVKKEYYGKNIAEYKENCPEFYSFIDTIYKKGEDIGTYTFYTDGAAVKELAYARYINDMEILIGTSVSQSVLDSISQRDLINSVKYERFGYKDYGYFWIINSEYNVVFHIDPEIYKMDLYTAKDSTGKYVFRDMVSTALETGSGFTQYKWALPGEATGSDKISYLTYIPEWDWIVGTGFYFADFNNLIATEEKISSSILQQAINKNMGIILGLLTAVVIISTTIFIRIRKIEDSQETYTNDLLQYKTVLDKSAIVSITDTRGVIVHVNDKLCEITGYARDTFIGSRHSIISHPDTPKSMYTDIWKTITEGGTWHGMLKNMKADGGYFYQESTIAPIRDKNGVTVRYISISNDVTEVVENRTRLQQTMHIDQLTGLKNRNSLLSTISMAKSADLAIIDLDDFHKINETYGMKAGDEVLKDFASKLRTNSNITDYNLYRLHSDVFAVFSFVSSQATFIKNVTTAVEEITRQIVVTDGKEIILQALTGFAIGSENLLSEADAALQHAKANNIFFHLFSSSQQTSAEHYEQNIKTVRMISSAVENNRVVPYFQPIAEVDGKGVKYEALMRIIDENGDVVSPAAFMDVSKQTRFYPELTRITAKKAMDAFKETDAEFSINISQEDLLNSKTMSFIYDYALETGVMKKMVLEIVETESISGSRSATDILYSFKLAGAKIAIDDFGSGYSNFDYLLKIKADYIKIDGSIIKLISKDERARDITTSIVSYSKKMNMKTIAEFISDQSLAKHAKELGVDYLQGYHIGKPMPEPVLPDICRVETYEAKRA